MKVKFKDIIYKVSVDNNNNSIILYTIGKTRIINSVIDFISKIDNGEYNIIYDDITTTNYKYGVGDTFKLTLYGVHYILLVVGYDKIPKYLVNINDGNIFLNFVHNNNLYITDEDIRLKFSHVQHLSISDAQKFKFTL